MAVMTKMMKLFLLACMFVFCCNGALAAPARPGKIAYRQPDGTVVTVSLHGDENYHYYVSEDGFALLPDGGGTLKYATLSADGSAVPSEMAAHGVGVRGPAEAAYVKTVDRVAVGGGLAKAYSDAVKAKSARRARRVAPGGIDRDFPTTGEIRGVIILAEFTDKKFSRGDINEVYSSMANDEGYSGPYASGSIRDYFTSQSGGRFVPTFDVIGPVQLPHESAYYASFEIASQLMIDACTVADGTTDVDFSDYDYDGDGYVDFVFVVFAGYGQAQGGGVDCVWPQAVDLTYESWNVYDGLYLSQSACSCELQGYDGGVIDGIGTFCHEFSHILGLPDIYDPAYSGMPGMLNWDIMDVGLYNDDSRTPAGYTAMDKYTVGWLEPVVLDSPAKDVELRPMSEANEAYFIVCGENADEYFTLENRQQTGWDKALPGHGLIISHVHYVPSLWSGNRVNTTSSGYEHVALVPADNMATDGTQDGDPFPGTSGNTSFTDTSHPAASWHTSTAAVDCPITNIREEDGIIKFDFKGGTTAINAVGGGKGLRATVSGGTLSVDNPLNERVSIVGADGRTVCESAESRVTVTPGRGVYVVRIGGTAEKIVVK